MLGTRRAPGPRWESGRLSTCRGATLLLASVGGLRDAAQPLLQRVQQTGQSGVDGEVVQRGRGEEAGVGDAAQGVEQRRPEAAGVEETDGLGVEAQLAP